MHEHPESLPLYCSACEKHVVANVRGYYLTGEDPDGVRDMFLVCPNCGNPFLTRQQEIYDVFGGQAEVYWSEPVVLYPDNPTTLDRSVPVNIANSYLEARRVFTSASAYTACAIMCRRTLEGVCNHFKADGPNLYKKLSDLKTKGLIDQRIYEWADVVLRSLGNDAAHDVDATISKEDAKDAVEFTKAIVEYLFVFEAAFHRFKTRREDKK